MDFLGSEISQKEQKTKKTIKLISIILVILLFISIGLVIYIYYLQSQQLKVTIDGQSISLSEAEKLFLFDEQDKSKIYISIKDIASKVGYQAFNGEYKQYSEDTNSCYIQNNYEVATYTKGSDKLYKLLTDGEDYEYFTIDEPVLMLDGKLYTTPEGISVGANISFSYSPENNRITIYTLDYLANSYANAYQDAAITGDKADFSNKKALLYERIVVTNSNGKYGVTDLQGNTIIGEKYDTIKFVESSKEFVVTTSDKKMGIISYDAITVIQPEYDDIKQIDKDLDLYLVKNNNKQGVINKNGRFIVYMEYDQIGIDATSFSNNNIKNQYLLYGNCIPVKRDKYWGLIDKNGNMVLPVVYECFGSSAKDKTSNSVLLIPQYEAIVVKGPTDDMVANTSIGEKKATMFGIVDKYGNTLIRNVLDEVYSITNSGVDTYYMVYNGQKIEVEEYFKEYSISAPDSKQEQETNTTENAIADPVQDVIP